MPSKVYANENDFTTGITDYAKETGETKENKVHNYQHTNAPDRIQFSTGNKNDLETLSTRTYRPSTSYSKLLASVKTYK